ncbi:TOL [Colletotrichum filicis]|nr:TOL [Colletotrichum filicis]
MSHSSVSAEDLNTPLGDQLYRRFIPSRFDDRCPRFLPEGCIERLVTERAIAVQLFGSDVTQPSETDLIRFVRGKAKKVFAIAVCCGFNNTDLLVTARFFQSIDFTDSHLPIANSGSNDPGSSAWNLPFPFDKMPESDVKQIWNGWKVNMFYERQWGFLAPVFSTTVFQHDLSPDCIFPFTWVNSIRKAGTFSHVYEVQIHPEHQKQPSSTVGGQLAHVAIKEIIVGDDDLRREIEKEYEDERKALSEITDLQHHHIIQRIAAITRGERRYFMFQWADGGNLREFWKTQEQPSLTPELVTQTITQLLGLADALHALHNFKGQGNYRHGDLKPENILRFRDETIVGILKIADMGLAKHHPDATAMRKKATSAKYGTVRYEPPEVITNRLDTARSRLYDIWSMGCIMFECIIWLLYGYTELERFDESLSASGYDSSFFKIKDVDNGQVAEVHPTVVEWMTSLATDPRCGTDSAIGDLLKLVRERLLVVPLRTQAPTWNIAVPQITTVTDTGSFSATNNIEKHMKGIDFEDLPATFKDAVTTTRELGFHHLWIDSICIKQGSHGDFKTESKHMENVFSSAYCVIAASRATGQESGFLGPRPERKYTTFNQDNEGIYHVCEQIDDFEGDVVQGNLNKRGWVLQERALAHRTIYFTERQTYWECGQGVRCETLTKLENNVAAFLGDPQFPTVAMNSPRGAKIHLYQDLYKQYSRLQFSRDEDRPFGIAGLEKRLIHSFKTQGGYGVLDDGEGLLRRSLLWQRGSASTLNRIIFPAERDMKVPTWSWMAYTGGIDYLEPPFDGVDWKTSEVQSPWADQAPDGLHHTSDKSLGITLSAVVREFAQSSTDQSMSRLVLDNPTKSAGEVSSLRVVIVGKTRDGSGSSQRRCYVLIVAPNTSKHVAGSLVYERMGVGYMAESCISPTGTSGRIQ